MIVEDLGQKCSGKVDKHKHKHKYWDEKGIKWERYPLPVGDYILCNDVVSDVIQRKQKRGIDVKKMDFLGSYKVCVDTKKDIQEIVGNVCGKQHPRFRDECILAQNNGIKLYVLVENTDGIKSIEDVFKWQNPRLHRYNKIAYMHNIGKWLNTALPKAKPTSGETLAKAMITMQKKYGVEFVFCHSKDAGAKVIELLGGDDNVRCEMDKVDDRYV